MPSGSGPRNHEPMSFLSAKDPSARILPASHSPALSREAWMRPRSPAGTPARRSRSSVPGGVDWSA